MRVILITAAIFLVLCITVTFSYIWSGNRWHQNPTYYINQDLESVISWGAFMAVRHAAQAWSSVPGQTFRLNYAGYTDRNGTLGDQDGYNVVGYGEPVRRPDNPAEAYWTTVGDKIVECDMILNVDKSWSAEPEENCPYWCFDVESVALHEFGHWAGLDDVLDNPRAVMYKWIGKGEVKRSLSSDDENGIKSIYPGGGGGGKGCDKGGGCDKIPVDPIDDLVLFQAPDMPYSEDRVWPDPLQLVKAFEGLPIEAPRVDPNWDILTLYWQNKCEILRVLSENTSLLEQAVELATRHRAEIEDLILGGDGGRLNAEKIDELTCWLAEFQEKASPNLKEAIMKVRQVLETCEGMTLREAISMDIDQRLIEASKRASIPSSWDITISPNPSHGSVNIRCDVPLQTHVCIEIYDPQGRSVGKVVCGNLTPGCYTWSWERRLSPAIYFVRIQASEYATTKKIVILGSGD